MLLAIDLLEKEIETLKSEEQYGAKRLLLDEAEKELIILNALSFSSMDTSGTIDEVAKRYRGTEALFLTEKQIGEYNRLLALKDLIKSMTE